MPVGPLLFLYKRKDRLCFILSLANLYRVMVTISKHVPALPDRLALFSRHTRGDRCEASPVCLPVTEDPFFCWQCCICLDSILQA